MREASDQGPTQERVGTGALACAAAASFAAAGQEVRKLLSTTRLLAGGPSKPLSDKIHYPGMKAWSRIHSDQAA
jgi:hypothetical protein